MPAAWNSRKARSRWATRSGHCAVWRWRRSRFPPPVGWSIRAWDSPPARWSGRGGVRDMELIDIDAVEAQPLEAAFDGFNNVSGAGVVLPDSGAVAGPANLGGDDQVLGIGKERFGDQLFRDIRAIGVGRIDKVKTGERRVW